MRPALKSLSAQTLVITGATSGVGLATARLAAQRGAKLMLVARNEQALRALCEELHARGGVAAYAVADVAEAEQVRAVAAKADEVYGGFDTWVNNAGVTIYGRIENTPIDDQRRLFETNYWGLVQGSLTAVEHLRSRTGGGALINVGSVLSDQAIPVQGVYSASKHAVKGFTNALRMELRKDAPQISVTLIKPSALDTPYSDHARNYTSGPAKNPPPVYAAPIAAEAILYAAETPVREITVGGAGRALALFGEHFPGLIEPLLGWATPLLSRGLSSESPPSEALHKAGRGLRERTPYFGVRHTSLYTAAQMNPKTTTATLFIAAVLLWIFLKVKDKVRIQRIKRRVRDRVRAQYEPSAQG